MMKIITSFIAVTLMIAALFFRSAGTLAQETHVLEVWKSPTCGCCGAWVEHMKAAGFSVRVHETEKLFGIKTVNGVPQNLRSCHTAKIGGYVVEGHVPASDVLTLLKTKPPVKGIAVPGMPLGSPGMEVPTGEKDAYDVLAFDGQGKTEIFASHNKETAQ